VKGKERKFKIVKYFIYRCLRVVHLATLQILPMDLVIH